MPVRSPAGGWFVTRRDVLAYATLCLLAGSGWILDAEFPNPLPPALSLFVTNLVLAGACFLAARRKLPPSLPSILACAALLFFVPSALTLLAGGRLSSTTIVLVYTLVPAATVFFAAQVAQRDFLGLLGPALAGIAGAALILPFALPSSSAGILWLAAIVLSALAAAFAGLRLHTLLHETSIVSSAALAASACALGALPLIASQHSTRPLLPWPQTVLTDGIQFGIQGAILLLTVRLLRDTDPVAFSTRFLLIPLVTIAEGYLLLHPRLTWTLVAGAALLAGGSALLLRPEHQP